MGVPTTWRWLVQVCRGWVCWLWFLLQVALVVLVEVADEVVHGLRGQNNMHAGLQNALRIVDFEADHGFWIEPRIQSFFLHTHHILGMSFGWNQVVPVVNGLYGLGHVFFTLAFAFWIYWRRRGLYPFLRNAFLLCNVLAVTVYETFPVAPPRLAGALPYDGGLYHFADSVFGSGGNGVKWGFNQYAAMPSLHVCWALIVGLTLAWVLRPLPLRIIALCYPAVMLITVIVTGNHYISDGLAAVALLACAVAISLVVEWWRRGEGLSFQQLLHRLQALSLPLHAGKAEEAAQSEREKPYRTLAMRRTGC